MLNESKNGINGEGGYVDQGKGDLTLNRLEGMHSLKENYSSHTSNDILKVKPCKKLKVVAGQRFGGSPKGIQNRYWEGI